MAIIGISGKIGSGKDTVGKIIQYLTSKSLNDLNTKDTKKEFISFLHSSYIPEINHWQIKKFAGKLKQIVSLLTGIPVEDLEKQEVKDRVLGEEWWYYWLYGYDKPTSYLDYKNEYDFDDLQKTTVRNLLQRVGTDAMRDVIHPNVWVNALFVDYKPFIENYPQLTKSNGKELIEGNSYSMGKAILPNWIITDMRFPNELQAVKDRGGVSIRLNRSIKHQVESLGGSFSLDSSYKLVSEHPSETALDNAEFDHIINNNGTIEELIEKVREVLIQHKIL